MADVNFVNVCQNLNLIRLNCILYAVKKCERKKNENSFIYKSEWHMTRHMLFPYKSMDLLKSAKRFYTQSTNAPIHTQLKSKISYHWTSCRLLTSHKSTPIQSLKMATNTTAIHKHIHTHYHHIPYDCDRSRKKRRKCWFAAHTKGVSRRNNNNNNVEIEKEKEYIHMWYAGV